MGEPLGSGHEDFIAALQREDVPFGGTSPVDEKLPPEAYHGLTEEQFWRLVKFEAEHEPDRLAYYKQLDDIARERRRQERIERLKNLPEPTGDRLTLDEALTHLEGVRRSGGKWRARCPIHGSQGGTLLISEDEARPGEPSIHCFAGCSFVSIVRFLKACR